MHADYKCIRTHDSCQFISDKKVTSTVTKTVFHIDDIDIMQESLSVEFHSIGESPFIYPTSASLELNTVEHSFDMACRYVYVK